MSSKKLNKKYSAAELADSFVFRSRPDAEAASQLAEARKKAHAHLSASQKLHAKVLQLRFQMEDYVLSAYYNDELSFAYFLRQYINLNYKTDKQFAHDINLDVTELSQVLNGHRNPSEKTMVRLELHSNNAIPAVSWNKLIEKQREHELETNLILREKEGKYVKKRLDF